MRNCTNDGIWVSGANGLKILNCNLEENGSTVVPGPHLQHNLLLSGCSEVRVTGSRLVGPPAGSGVSVQKCAGVTISNCETGRNGWYGVAISESTRVAVTESLVEGNDRSGILLEFLHRGSVGVDVTGNTIWYNNGFRIESYATGKLVVAGNRYIGNGGQPECVKTASDRRHPGQP